jgi:Acetoacetate decarboxylase (ADC)
MPLFGLLEVESIAPHIAWLRDLNTEAWALPRAEILQLVWEVDDSTRALLPKAMHPAVPPYATLVVTVCPESPVGPFNMAQLRLMGRAGAHPRGYVIGAVASTPAAVAALRERWGFPAELGSVALRHYHDRVTAAVTRQGAPVLEAALVDPEPISGAQIQYIHSVTVASLHGGGKEERLLVQVDPHYTFHSAERGRSEVRRFDTAAWNAPGLAPLHSISASLASCDTDLPQIRFVMDVARPVVSGTRKIR